MLRPGARSNTSFFLRFRLSFVCLRPDVFKQKKHSSISTLPLSANSPSLTCTNFMGESTYIRERISQDRCQRRMSCCGERDFETRHSFLVRKTCFMSVFAPATKPILMFFHQLKTRSFRKRLLLCHICFSGCAVYTGQDTKVSLNSEPKGRKYSRIEK